MKKSEKSYFMISTVAQSYGIHPQTLRLYEREGLLKPSRTVGNTRVYTESDLKQLEVILNLTRDLGVNLAGVEIILNMRNKMERMQGEINDFLKFLGEELQQGAQARRTETKNALMRIAQTKLIRVSDSAAEAMPGASREEKAKR